MEPDDVTFRFLREITDDFSEKRKIGEGSFGVVYKGVTTNGEDVAVKKLKFSDTNLNDKQFRTELNNLRKLEHKNIVRILGYCYETEKIPFNKPDGSKVYLEETHRALCFEYLDNGSLQGHLSDEFCGLEWHTRFKIIMGTCEGLKYIHEELEAPICHLDLKPDNILLDKDMVPKIADFGLSRIFNKEPKRTTPNPYGTLGYQPPEYIDRGEISEKFDIFSLGVIMIRIVTGSNGYPKCLEMPTDGFIDQVQNNWRNRLQATCRSNSSLEAYFHQIETCTQIALKCVENDSQKRPNIVTIITKLNEIETHIGEKWCHKTIFGMTMHNKKIMRTNDSKDITCQHQNTNLMIDPSCSELNVVDEREKSTDVIEELIVGRTEEKMKIMDILHGVMSEKIVILPIYGIGGIGKTTFARLIYNDQKFKHYSQVWVDVSLRFDLNKILESILSQLSGKESQANERQIIHSCITKLLAGKKILDDLWEDDQLQLQELKNMLYHDKSKIIVLVTTRSEHVADRMCVNLQPYKILPLTNDMCWDIIKQRSGFEGRDDRQQLMGIGLEIAQKCGGVPLAARSLGFTLRSMNFDQWMEVKASGIWNEPISKEVSLPNHALASLKLSYSYMDPCLKPCFTYCAIFPKGHKIVKNDIVYQWISMGFIKPTKLLSNIQLSEKYIVQLLGLSFFQNSVLTKTVAAYYEDATVFTMHDLVHDLATLVDQVLDSRKQGNIGESRIHLELQDDCTESLQATQYPTNIRGLRFLESDRALCHGASSSSTKFMAVRVCGKIGMNDDGVFSSAKDLHVLDLSECSIMKLPNSIGNLKQLRYLNAPRVQHWVFPLSITKLSKLTYLSLRGSEFFSLPDFVLDFISEMEGLMYLDLSGSRIGNLPLSFRKLTKLVHLDFSKCSATNISKFLKSLTNLEYLDLSCCECIGFLSENFGSLLKLRYLDISNSSCICPYGCFSSNAEVLFTLTKLECLNLSSPEGVYRAKIRNLTEALNRLTNLKYLNLSDVSTECGMEGPMTFGILKNLVYLDLSHCSGVHGVLDSLGSLTKLQHLNMSRCSCFDDCTEFLLSRLSEGIRNLTELHYLKLSDCSGTPGHPNQAFFVFLECIGSLQNLEHLDLSSNKSMTSLPDSFRSLRKLHTLDVSNCRNLQLLPSFLNEMDRLKFLELKDCFSLDRSEHNQLNKSLAVLPDFVVHSGDHDSGSNLCLLQDVNRTDLVISRLENVKSVQEAQSIKLAGKDRMQKLELNWTKDVERFVEDMEVLEELVPPTTLTDLRIYGYNSFKFPEWFHLPNLVHISMSNIPKCNSLPPLGQLSSLRELVLERMNGISEINWDLCGSRRAFPRLTLFTLRGMENLRVWYTTYPGGRDGVNKFMFPNLWRLEIIDCPKLRMKPCPHRVSWSWNIKGRSDGVISPSGEGASQISVTTPASVPVPTLFITGCKVPMYEWRLLHHLPGLSKLHISECGDLSSSPDIIRALSSLHSLKIEELPDWLGQLASLVDLTLRGHDVKEPHDGFPHLTRLRSLCISEFESMAKVEQWVGSLVSLQKLEIRSCENLNDLAESFGRLSSLKELEIQSCNKITSLPDSIGCLTSLKNLCIGKCHYITCLPESIQQLTNLKSLLIDDCEELKKWCKTEENKAMLAHVDYKRIDWRHFF